MPSCDNCGEHVSARYYRVRCGNDGDLHACPACCKYARRERYAAGASLDYERRGLSTPAAATDGGTDE